MQRPRSNRNPIKFHGNRPAGSFIQVENELVRDDSLSSDARMTQILLLSHEEGFEQSAASLAKVLGRNRKTVFNALKELDAARRVVVQRYLTADRKPTFQIYHVRRTGHFTEAEAAALRIPVVLPRPAQQEDTEKPAEGTGGSPELGPGDVPVVDHKEDHLEHAIEDKGEDPLLGTNTCVLCASTFDDDQTSLVMTKAGYNGMAHESCLLSWLFENPVGQNEFRLMLDGGERGRRLADVAEKRYRELTRTVQ